MTQFRTIYKISNFLSIPQPFLIIFQTIFNSVSSKLVSDN